MVESDWLYCGIGLPEVPKTEQSSFTMIPQLQISQHTWQLHLGHPSHECWGESEFQPHLMKLSSAWQSRALTQQLGSPLWFSLGVQTKPSP